ncbi:glycosyl transferase [Arthrobacter alpinus]|uniref:Glycosyl transferase n=2 Tax=Arthrobacter alpinus TaxID=656366 RepID=A0A0S2M2F1_9MICC|nr:glycosyl transferase [Arthrobacter alpinus]
MIGTRGVPAAYGGFETAIEEIGKRLVARGHSVTVYCRKGNEPRLREHEGMKLVHLPSIRAKVVETLSHTAISVLHACARGKPDVAFVFNAANSPFVPALHLRAIPTAVHVDGLEWLRGKWGSAGRRYYRFAESFAVRTADAIIADAQGIADYYEYEFGVSSHLLRYGSPILNLPSDTKLESLSVSSKKFHLVVARFEPENNVEMIVRGYHASNAKLPLVVVGSAPYSASYTNQIEEIAKNDERIRLLGGVWDQDLLDQLYAHALTYLHGHSVGGTNPSLLRAMGAATAVCAFDVVFNREVLGDLGQFFCTPSDVTQFVSSAESSPHDQVELGDQIQRRAARLFNWDDVALGYEGLARDLAAGKGERHRRAVRRSQSAWTVKGENYSKEDSGV